MDRAVVSGDDIAEVIQNSHGKAARDAGGDGRKKPGDQKRLARWDKNNRGQEISGEFRSVAVGVGGGGCNFILSVGCGGERCSEGGTVKGNAAGSVGRDLCRAEVGLPLAIPGKVLVGARVEIQGERCPGSAVERAAGDRGLTGLVVDRGGGLLE